MKRQLHLNLFIHSRGHHEASWRHPDTSPLPLTDIRYYQDLAQRAERAQFDSIFLADQLALGGDVAQAPRTWLEPITVLAALAAVTSRIGVDRHRLDHLHRAVQFGAAIRINRPHQ
jgi:alkanesulfonate monooxygenase SsuD/methylene tetrahydromethanopterin reductase-like flavin-dependent oxidoreductase (luciferase family)